MSTTTSPTPGIDWRRRSDGRRVPYWIARRDAVKAGYPVKSVNLSHLADEPDELAARCRILDAEQKEWLAEQAGMVTSVFDGTFRSLFRIYQTHADSPYREVRKDTRRTFDDGAKVFLADLADEYVASTTGLDIRRWWKHWKEPVADDKPERARRAKKCIQALTVALGFGQALQLPGCFELRTAVLGLRFPNAPRRKVFITYEQASAFIDKAIARGDVPHALAQAIMFEATLRQKDVIGEWEEGEQGGIVALGKTWDRGLVWGTHISRDLILQKASSKTGNTVTVDLRLCPLVMRVLQHVPAEKRVGPVIMHESAGRPFFHRYYAEVWREIATAAGIPAEIWNMDSRAGGVTEGRAAGASLENLRHLAGHSNVGTTARYDRPTAETTSKIMELRTASRAAGNALETEASNAFQRPLSK